jgi:hypothetical protein
MEGTVVQGWNAHAVVAQSLARVGDSVESARSCANSHASILGLQRQFDVADVSTVRRGTEAYLVYRLQRGAAIGVCPLGSPESLIRRGLFTLTTGQRFSRWIWMNAELFAREAAAPCLPVGVIRHADGDALPYLDRTHRRSARPRSPDPHQLLLTATL